jgi:hypothetical protein
MKTYLQLASDMLRMVLDGRGLTSKAFGLVVIHPAAKLTVRRKLDYILSSKYLQQASPL